MAPFLSCYHLFLQPLLLYHHFFWLEAAGSRGKVAGSRGAQQVVVRKMASIRGAQWVVVGGSRELSSSRES
jgi:hypothetical protein